MTDLRVEVEERLSSLEAALVARGMIRKIAGKVWDELLHPRGRDGKFIEKNGWVNGTFQVADGGGKPVSLEGNNRVKVTGFANNPNNPDDPYVNVVLTNGTPAQGLASQVQMAAPLKGRLNEGEGMGLPEAEVGPREVPTPEQDPLAQPAEAPAVDAPFTPDVVEPPSTEEVAPAAPVAEAPEAPLAPVEGETLETGTVVFDDSSFNPPDSAAKQTITPGDISQIQKGPGEPVETDSVDEALELLASGQKVKLHSTDEVAVLLDRMLEMYQDAEARGDTAPTYNLCNVFIEGASLFCAEHKDINRIFMPQLKGIPIPGTPAAALPANAKGEVDLGPAFRKHLEDMGVAILDSDVPASHLKATQNELSGSKVAGMGKAMEAGNMSPQDERLFTSRDNYVVDGHHRWGAALGVDLKDGQGGDIFMPTAAIDMDILDVIAEANDFAISMGIPQAGVSAPPPSSQTQTQLLERTTAA